MARRASVTHRIYLVPGFLGFSNLGELRYFTHVRDGGFDWHKDDKVCRDEGYSTELIGREAAKFVSEHAGKEPFFLYVPFNGVHSPHQAPKEDIAAYPDLKGRRRHGKRVREHDPLDRNRRLDTHAPEQIELGLILSQHRAEQGDIRGSLGNLRLPDVEHGSRSPVCQRLRELQRVLARSQRSPRPGPASLPARRVRYCQRRSRIGPSWVSRPPLRGSRRRS